jgi:hypothetical protein
MEGNHRRDIPKLGGGRLIGQQQVQLIDLRVVPAINLSITGQAGPVPLGRPCLQVIDLSTGNGMICPVDSRWMRDFAGQLKAAADHIDASADVGSANPIPTTGGSDG